MPPCYQAPNWRYDVFGPVGPARPPPPGIFKREATERTDQQSPKSLDAAENAFQPAGLLFLSRHRAWAARPRQPSTPESGRGGKAVGEASAPASLLNELLSTGALSRRRSRRFFTTLSPRGRNGILPGISRCQITPIPAWFSFFPEPKTARASWQTPPPAQVLEQGVPVKLGGTDLGGKNFRRFDIRKSNSPRVILW